MDIIRKATVNDIPAIREIAGVAFPATYSDIITEEQIAYMMEWMYSEDVLRKEIAGDVTWLLMELDGVASGYVSFGPEGTDGQYHLHKIYILPACQGKGHGRALFLAAEEEMRRRGAEIFELNVNRHNKALDFYLKMGMKINRSGDFDIGGGFYMNDYILRKYLRSDA